MLGIEPGPAGGVLPALKAGAGLDRAAAIDDLAAIVVLGRALAARPVGEALVGREVVGVIGGEADGFDDFQRRSEEHTTELQSLMRISYAVLCLTKKNN